MKNEKYCAAVASVSWLTDAAYPLRVHTVFLRFPNFELSQKSRLGLLAKLCGVALMEVLCGSCFCLLFYHLYANSDHLLKNSGICVPAILYYSRGKEVIG